MRKIHLKNATSISVDAVVRVIPNQREVVRGYWNEMAVYAKVFTGPRAKLHFLRDITGVKLLQDRGIATPALLHQDTVASVNLQVEHTSPTGLVAIYAAVDDAINAEVAYSNASSQSRSVLLFKLVETIALHHASGLYQSDLHLKNFLLVQAEVRLAEAGLANECDDDASRLSVYTIDGDGVRPLPYLFTRYVARKNLATFFAKIDVLDMVLLPRLYAHYCQVRAMNYDCKELKKIIRQSSVIRYQAASAYADHKVFRNCTDVKLNHFSQTHCWVARANTHLIAALTIDALDDCLVTPAFKAGNTCTVGLLTLSHAAENLNSSVESKDIQPYSSEVASAIKPLVVKRYNIKHGWHALLRSVRTTRAAHSWANAHRLTLLGLPTPTPVALIEKRYFYNMLKSQSYYVAEYIDAPDVVQFFAAETDKIQRANVLQEVAMLFYKLYLLNISHGDMKATNLKIYHGKPVLIDLDSMRQYRFAWAAKPKHVRDLKRFMRNWSSNSLQDISLTAALTNAFKMVYADQTPLIQANML